MLSAFLLPETTLRDAGISPVLALGDAQGEKLLLTVAITHAREQESIEFSIWGSADGSDWGVRPLVSFPQRFYCGVYPVSLDLSAHWNVKYLRAQWLVRQWGRSQSKPLFAVSLLLEEPSRQLLAIGA
jgi:hypothetical protein